MQFMLFELVQMGGLQLLVDFSNPYLSIPAWIVLLLGIWLQYFLLKKKKAKSYAAVLAFGVLASEVLCNAITGWDRLLPMLLYAVVLYLIIGAVIATVIYYIKRA